MAGNSDRVCLREDTDRGRAEGEREAEQLASGCKSEDEGGAVHV